MHRKGLVVSHTTTMSLNDRSEADERYFTDDEQKIDDLLERAQLRLAALTQAPNVECLRCRRKTHMLTSHYCDRLEEVRFVPRLREGKEVSDFKLINSVQEVRSNSCSPLAKKS